MNIGRVLKIAFAPRVGTLLYLAIFGLSGFVSLFAFERMGFTTAVSGALGYMFMALELKLLATCMTGIFLDDGDDTLPRMGMFLAIVFLAVGALVLVLPVFEHARIAAIS